MRLPLALLLGETAALIGPLTYYSQPKSWADAEAHCESLGGRLPWVFDADDNTEVQALTGNSEFWIGGRWSSATSQFTWGLDTPYAFYTSNTANGEQYKVGDMFENWRTDVSESYPSNGYECVRHTSGSSNRWETKPCTSAFPFACEIPTPPCEAPRCGPGLDVYPISNKHPATTSAVDGAGCYNPDPSLYSTQEEAALGCRHYCLEFATDPADCNSAWVYTTSSYSGGTHWAPYRCCPKSSLTWDGNWLDGVTGTYFFSFGKDGPNGGATGGKDNCILLRESGLTLNTWQHLVLTWDGTTMTTYLDGGSAPSICHDPACHDAGGIAGCLQTAAATGSLVVGNDQDAHTGEWVVNQPDQAANVMIDTFAIYSTAWSAAEVASRTSYCAERNGLDLYALWSGPSGEDLSGHGWTAEVTSAAAGDTCPHVDGEAGACVATAVDACA